MGAWGYGVLENDSATRLLDALASEENPEQRLSRTIEADAESSPDAGEAVLAGAAVIAGASVDPPRAPAEYARWIRDSGFVPSGELQEEARRSVARVVWSSALRELWAETADFDRWLDGVLVLLDNLSKAASSERPKRKPRSPRSPRNLGDLIGLVGMEKEDHALFEKLRTRLNGIDDIDESRKDCGYRTVLLCLVQARLPLLVAEVLARGADPNVKSAIGGLPLEKASGLGDIEVAKLLLDHGAKLCRDYERPANSLDLPLRFSYSVPLALAATSGTPEMVDFLVGKGGDLLQVGINGETLLHLAALGGNPATIRHLVELGLSTEAVMQRGETALHRACLGGKEAAINALLDCGANVGAKSSLGETPYSIASLRGDVSTAVLERLSGGGT